jgi:gluconate 2-dehydrogenase subunit 3-like protein
VERRTVLLHLAGGLAGTVVSANPSAAAGTAANPDHVQSSNAAAVSSSAPRALDDHQRQTLASLAEMLVPGAAAAGVVDLVDRVLAVESTARRREFFNALGAFEREARESHGQRWIDLDEAARTAILQKAAAGEESRPLPPPWQKGQPVISSPVPTLPATLRDHFTRLRTAVANAYFSTEPGMRELGWRGRTGWTALPGCEHPEGDHE